MRHNSQQEIHMPKAITTSLFMATLVASLVSLTACAQTGPQEASVSARNAQAAWRAGFRLGYAPTPASARAAGWAPKA